MIGLKPSGVRIKISACEVEFSSGYEKNIMFHCYQFFEGYLVYQGVVNNRLRMTGVLVEEYMPWT